MQPSKNQLNELLSYLPALETPGCAFGVVRGMMTMKCGEVGEI